MPKPCEGQGLGSATSGAVCDTARTWMTFTGSLCTAILQASWVDPRVYRWGRQRGLGNSLPFREALSTWAAHQPLRELLYLLLLTTHFSQASAVMKTGQSTTLWQFHLFLLFPHKPKQRAAVASSAAWWMSALIKIVLSRVGIFTLSAQGWQGGEAWWAGAAAELLTGNVVTGNEAKKQQPVSDSVGCE